MIDFKNTAFLVTIVFVLNSCSVFKSVNKYELIKEDFSINFPSEPTKVTEEDPYMVSYFYEDKSIGYVLKFLPSFYIDYQ